MAWRVFLAIVFLAALAGCGRRVLYVTHTAGFRHDSIPLSRDVLAGVAARTGQLQVFATEDLGWISSEGLAAFDAVFFFTSGELALSAEQKQALLDFVRRGNGFGGVHSATDTLYTWPEYGELIGGVFDGHPWAQEVTILVEDRQHPATRHLPESFRIADEIYQFRSFSRERVRVLLRLDPESVDLGAPGVNRTDRDFALAWCHTYGQGRVFYTALGHPDEVWQDERFQRMLEGALLWITGQVDGDATPRPAPSTP
jgi:type 1 glutamine amidotransferase